MAVACSQIHWIGFWLLIKYSILLGVYAVALLALGELRWEDLKLLGAQLGEKAKVEVPAQ
jgi:hypothetical protein